MTVKTDSGHGMTETAHQIMEAAEAKKCWCCGCLHGSLRAIEADVPESKRSPALKAAMAKAHDMLVDVRYDCIGCEVCFPALAINALSVESDPCPTDEVEEREGWPPLPGSFTVIRYQAPVAICTLIDDDLAETISRITGPEIAIVGSMKTENLGIERMIRNVITNPNIRFLILCGGDTKQRIGHLPGQSTLSLFRSGLDKRQRIIGAEGKRPVIKNLSSGAVEHFRRALQPIDLIGCTEVPTIMKTAQSCAQRSPGPAEPYEPEQTIESVRGHMPQRVTPDPSGYFVIYIDQRRRLLVLEHYLNSGAINAVIEGQVAAELYATSIEKGLLSRLDHAAYLGHELARAERALREDEPFNQDAAPERTQTAPGEGCGCTTQCGGQE